MHYCIVVQEDNITLLPYNVHLHVFGNTQRQLEIRRLDGRIVAIRRKRMLRASVTTKGRLRRAMVARATIC